MMNFESYSINDVIRREFNPSSPNRQMAEKIASTLYGRVYPVRGDGKCLIYSLLIVSFLKRTPQVFSSILETFMDRELIEQLLQHWDNAYLSLFAEMMMDWVKIHWDYPSDINYHYDQNAIDGLFREMIMRMLCIRQVKVTSLCPGKEAPSRIFEADPEVFFNPYVEPITVDLLCVQGYNHYSGLF